MLNYNDVTLATTNQSLGKQNISTTFSTLHLVPMKLNIQLLSVTVDENRFREIITWFIYVLNKILAEKSTPASCQARWSNMFLLSGLMKTKNT